MTCLVLFVCAGTLEQVGYVPVTPPLRVRVVLSTAAREKLQQRGEQMKAFGAVFGIPKAGVRTHGGEVGLGSFTTPAVPVGSVLNIASITLNQKDQQKISGRLMLLINVVTARLSANDNLVSCDFYEGPLPSRMWQTVTLHCGLIMENPPTQWRRSFDEATPVEP